MGNDNALKAITLAIAAIGAVLGVINTWAMLRRDRVRLKVIPSHATAVGGGLGVPIDIAIRIVNMSSFPVFVSGAGFLLRQTRIRAAVLKPLLVSGPANWPIQLAPRSAITVYAAMPDLGGNRIKKAYAETECGVVKTGTNRALKQIARKAANKP